MEITANALQSVASGSNVVFTDTAVKGSKCIIYREGSGLVTLRGLTNQCKARFKITFGANVALPTGTSPVAPILMALAINGEPVQTSTMISTPTVVESFGNISRTLFIDIPAGCCSQISVENTGTSSVSVQNANLIIERVA